MRLLTLLFILILSIQSTFARTDEGFNYYENNDFNRTKNMLLTKTGRFQLLVEEWNCHLSHMNNCFQLLTETKRKELIEEVIGDIETLLEEGRPINLVLIRPVLDYVNKNKINTSKLKSALKAVVNRIKEINFLTKTDKAKSFINKNILKRENPNAFSSDLDWERVIKNLEIIIEQC